MHRSVGWAEKHAGGPGFNPQHWRRKKKSCKINSCCFKPLNLCWFVTAAIGNSYTPCIPSHCNYQHP
jgi:hypothetical protein